MRSSGALMNSSVRVFVLLREQGAQIGCGGSTPQSRLEPIRLLAADL